MHPARKERRWPSQIMRVAYNGRLAGLCTEERKPRSESLEKHQTFRQSLLRRARRSQQTQDSLPGGALARQTSASLDNLLLLPPSAGSMDSTRVRASSTNLPIPSSLQDHIALLSTSAALLLPLRVTQPLDKGVNQSVHRPPISPGRDESELPLQAWEADLLTAEPDQPTPERELVVRPARSGSKTNRHRGKELPNQPRRGKFSITTRLTAAGVLLLLHLLWSPTHTSHSPRTFTSHTLHTLIAT